MSAASETAKSNSFILKLQFLEAALGGTHRYKCIGSERSSSQFGAFMK